MDIINDNFNLDVVQGLFYVWLEYGGGKGVCRRLLSRHADKKKREREREEVDVAETSKNKKTE